MNKHYIFFIDISQGFESVKNKFTEFLVERKKTEPLSIMSVITLDECYNIIVVNESLNMVDVDVFEKLKNNCDKLTLFDTLAPAIRKILNYHNILELKGYDTRAVIFVKNSNDTSTIVSQSSLLLQFIYAYNKDWKIYFSSSNEKLCLIFNNIGCQILELDELKSLI